MDVGSKFSIYGNLFGWHVFDLTYEFLVGTGLILIPFLIMLYNAFMARDEGNKYDPVSALISIEIKAYVAVAVIIIFLVPSVNVNKALFIYIDGSKTHESGNTGTTFDKHDATLPGSVKIPFGWYAILYASTGFTTVMKTILPTGDSARELMYQLQQANMDDSEVQKQLNDFERQCAIPARSKINVIMNKYGNSVIAKNIVKYAKTIRADVSADWFKSEVFLASDMWKIAGTYPGNEIFKQWIFNDSIHYCTSTDAAGNTTEIDKETVLCMPGTDVVLSPSPYKSCNDMWIVTRKSLTDYYSKNFTEIFKNDDGWLYGRLNQSNIQTSTTGIGDLKGSGLQKFTEVTAALWLNWGSKLANFFNAVLRFYLPIMLGVIMMFFIMLLPIFIVFSRYQLSTIAGLGISFFGITFLPGIWHIAAWLDQVMILAVYGPKGVIDATVSLERAVLDIVALAVYLIFTKLWWGFVREMGGAATHAIDQASGNAGAASDAHGKTSRGLSNSASSANRERVKRKDKGHSHHGLGKKT